MSRKGDSGGNSGGVISSLRSIIGGGKEPGPKHDDDADELVLDSTGFSADDFARRVLGDDRDIEDGKQDDDNDALVLDAAVATTPGDSAAAPDDNTPDDDDAYVLVSDTGAEADQQIPEDQSGAVSDGGENASPIDDALDQFDTPMAEAGADADSDVTVAAEAEGGDTATGDDDGDPAAAETPDADGSDALNSPVLEAPAEMATIFSGLAVEESENFGGDEWSAAVREKIRDDADDAPTPNADGSPTPSADDAPTPSADDAAGQANETSIPVAAAMPDAGELEETIRRVIREELSGEMGQRLSKNIQRMIRDQVASALFPRD